MGMQSDIATEGTIRTIVAEIERQLTMTTSGGARNALKSLGRFALEQFEWDTPKWAAHYVELFKEKAK